MSNLLNPQRHPCTSTKVDQINQTRCNEHRSQNNAKLCHPQPTLPSYIVGGISGAARFYPLVEVQVMLDASKSWHHCHGVLTLTLV